MDYGTFQGILTIIVMVTFVGIFFWAYSKHSKSKFDEAANLVFADDEQQKMSQDSGEQK
ncbi:cbb3-type cytochrome oxidase subunit 3 [Shewanella aestuarii]|uniref:Cbb3-type cytochrome c oxidase subunit 3 n=1 Tax=Shewanella aestuarii TaxID=1028752 RepID=A0A6G9QQS8_9GAMM|nr:cbb3-type cytochrome c oxidase subunit 3 [Shewanella aestuarii]QIR16169.1 cbb3-type cytochrome c oxidase subunit 3 [Shewanella aestuarii]